MEPRPAPKRRPQLIVEIALVIACKLCIIFCLWWLFFSPEHRTTVTPDKMGDAIFSSAPSEVQTPPRQTLTNYHSNNSTINIRRSPQ